VAETTGKNKTKETFNDRKYPMKTTRKPEPAQSIASALVRAKRAADLQNRLALAAPTSTTNKFPLWARVLLGAMCLTGLVLILVQLCFGAKPMKPITANSVTDTGSSQRDPENTEISLGLRKGDRLVYGFQQERLFNILASNSGEVATPRATNQSATMRHAQSGDLIVNVYDEAHNGWTVGFSFEKAILELVVGERVTPAEQLEASLGSEILVFIEKSGRIRKMSAPANTPPETLSLWRDILSRWQTVLASDAGARTWTRTEEDATGTYAAVYSRESDRAPIRVRKQKAQYLAVNGASQKGFEARFKINGAAIIELAPYPTNIEGQEQLRLLTPEIGGSVNSEASYSFHLLRAAQENQVEALGPEMVRQLQSGGVPFGWASTTSPRSQTQTVDVSKTTIEKQITELEQLLAAGRSGTAAEVKTLEKIAALIRNDDASVEGIANYLGTPQVLTNMGLSSALIGMLGAAGTPKAQETLIGIAHTKEWPFAQRQMAIFSLAQVTQPTPEIDGWLQQMHQENGDLANNSLLILAAMGDQVREQNPERFNQISDYVIKAASAPGLALNERIVGLDAIGNLAPQDIPQVVQDALAGEDALLREKALQSLQRVDADTTYPMIRNALQNDSAESVRAVAANLLGDTRRSGGIADLSGAVVNDTSEQVRVSAVRSLGQWLVVDPGVSSVLQQVASQDSSQDVRDAAARILQSQRNFEVAAAAVPAGR
jgi:HEAT repeat protein